MKWAGRRGWQRGGAKGRQPGFFQIVAVKKIVRVERNEAAVGMNDVDAGFFHGANVESVSVEKLHDQHAENILVGKLHRCSHAREAAEQIAQRGSAGFGRMIRREKLEQAIANSWLFFVDDGVPCSV